MSRDVDKIISSANGEIDSEDISNSGNSGFFSLSTGYPTKPVIDYLKSKEKLHYLITNYTDGVNIDEDTISLSKDKRNFICVTDSRVLIIIGDDEKDKTFEYKHKRIIDSEFASGIVSSNKLKINVYDQAANKKDIKFPVKEGSNGKAASQYINSKCKAIKPSAKKSHKNNKYTTSNESTKKSRSTQKTTNTSTAKKQKSIDEGDKKQIKQKLDKIRSDIKEINRKILNAEFQQAKQLSDDVDSRITSLKRKTSQKDVKSIEQKIQRVDRKHSNQLSKSHVLSEIRNMDPPEFEELVAEIWKKQGFNVQVTSRSADKGIDIKAIKKDDIEQRKHLIQAKRHGENSTVGGPKIREYAGLYVGNEDPDKVFVVSSNQFSDQAKEEARDKNVQIMDCDELYEKLSNT